MNVDRLIAENKKKKLISLGYCEREYIEATISTGDYTLKDKEKGKYYKLVPLEVTDEQWAKILEIGDIRVRDAGALPSAFKWLGVITLIIAVIIGFIAAKPENYRDDFSAIILFSWWGAGAAACLTLLWMGEVLRAVRTR